MVDLQLFNSTDTIWLLVIVAAVVIALIAAVAAVPLHRKRRAARLRKLFGPTEFDRARKAGESRRVAEAGIDGRMHRVGELRLQPLGEGDRSRFVETWRAVPSRFVDGPKDSVMEADRIVERRDVQARLSRLRIRAVDGGRLRRSPIGAGTIACNSPDRSAPGARPRQYGGSSTDNGTGPDPV